MVSPQRLVASSRSKGVLGLGLAGGAWAGRWLRLGVRPLRLDKNQFSVLGSREKQKALALGLRLFSLYIFRIAGLRG